MTRMEWPEIEGIVRNEYTRLGCKGISAWGIWFG
jgi:hypothetical protein